MRDLQELRDEIDVIDEQIAALYEQRMAISDEVADYKIANGKQVFDQAREKSKLDKLSAMASSDFTKTGLIELFRQLMSMSRKLQYQKLTKYGALGNLPFIGLDEIPKKDVRIVYQGVPGAYSEKAVCQFFGDDANRFHVASFKDAMLTISDGAADYAVLPIENSTAGIVTENYDMLSQFENYIIGEVYVKIAHCLMGLPGSTLADIDVVFSHNQGLMQCHSFLESHPKITAVEVENTAMAAKMVGTDTKMNHGAIASAKAADLYGLTILAEDISEAEENETRFIIVTNQRVFQKDAKKISISFQIPHEPGSLYRLMSHFIYNGLNMTKIESRPIPEMQWEYRFFVDFEGNLADSAVKNAIRGLREEAHNLRILGNY